MGERKVLITGAGRGLGLCLTETCLANGYIVYACLLQKPADKILRLKEYFGENLIIIPMDVSEDISVEKAAEALSKYTDSLDILINNAAIHPEDQYSYLENFDTGIAIKTYNTNSLGPMRVTKNLLSFLEKGSMKMLVNISSEAGSMSKNWRDFDYIYCMTKAALNMQSVILQEYLKPKGIKVLSIHPGGMKTDMNPNGEVDPVDSAEGIFKLANLYEGVLDGPVYLDFTGAVWTW